MDKLILNIEKDNLKKIQQLKSKLQELRTEPETKELMAKLESVHPQFLYNCFHEVFTGFGSLQEALDTCSTISHSLMDDGCFYLKTEESETAKEMRLRMFEKMGKEFPIRLTESITLRETEDNTWMDQEKLLAFIDREEKNDINSLNSFFNIRKNIDGGTISEKSLDMLGDLSRFEGFSLENMMTLDEDIKKHFKVQL